MIKRERGIGIDQGLQRSERDLFWRRRLLTGKFSQRQQAYETHYRIRQASFHVDVLKLFVQSPKPVTGDHLFPILSERIFPERLHH